MMNTEKQKYFIDLKNPCKICQLVVLLLIGVYPFQINFKKMAKNMSCMFGLMPSLIIYQELRLTIKKTISTQMTNGEAMSLLFILLDKIFYGFMLSFGLVCYCLQEFLYRLRLLFMVLSMILPGKK